MTKCAFIPNFLRFYNMLWQAALPFLRRNRRLAPSFDKRVTPDHLTRADIWIQAASAGEAFLALSILSELTPRNPTRVLVTTTTDQGFDILEKGIQSQPISPSLDICLDLFPFDIPSAIETAVGRVNPKVMVLLETEIWPALFHALKQNQTPILILNARMSKKSGRHYRLTRKLWQCMAPDHILAISEGDKKRYRKVFPTTPVDLMDNIKFDIMGSDQRGAIGRPGLKTFLPGPLPLSLLASFRRQEEAEIIPIIQTLRSEHPDQIIALFPRHMHRITPLKKQLKEKGIPFLLRSELNNPVTTPCLILWDTFGELREAYRLAASVFVGGSLVPLGGQNFLEPFVLGIPTVIGPHWEDFAWAGDDILDQGIVSRANDAKGVAQTMLSHLNAPRTDKGRKALKQKALGYIYSRQGGSEAACQAILNCL